LAIHVKFSHSRHPLRLGEGGNESIETMVRGEGTDDPMEVVMVKVKGTKKVPGEVDETERLRRRVGSEFFERGVEKGER
jgi:hypothetical protein